MPIFTMFFIRLPVNPRQRPAADGVGEVRHLPEDFLHLGHDVLAVFVDLRTFWRTQGHVQHGAVLGHVYVLAREHRLYAFVQTGPLGQSNQQARRSPA